MKIVKNIKYIFLFIALSASLFTLTAQEFRLADLYYQDGEYEKAASIYQSLYIQNKSAPTYLMRYVECLVALKQYEKAEKALKDEVALRPGDPGILITLGNVYGVKGDTLAAQKIYDEASRKASSNPALVEITARSFISQSLFEYAAKVYENAQKINTNKSLYAYSLAELYRRMGKSDKMIDNYLLSVATFGSNMSYLMQIFERYLGEEDITVLQTKLYASLQAEPDQILYNELLEWSFINQKEYKKALRQARALDRKLNENGGRVVNIANIAYADKDFDTAIEGYQYILDNKSINSTYYLDAKKSALNAKKEKVTGGYNYSKTDLASLKADYESFLNDYGRNSQTALLMVEYADFSALFLNEVDTAKALLHQVIGFGGVQNQDVANAKLKLADYYLIEEDQWEASLLYSQVDKEFKEGQLGEWARYKNAKLSYFMGDFDWAQDQFDILKSATSRLISNDAIDLSVFIMDNLNLDTTARPMELFAKSELLIFQNKLTESVIMLDSLSSQYPEHSLQDDILYVKAQICKKRQQPEEAAKLYQIIIEKYPEEIRCDNAMYDLAFMNESVFNNIEKAKELYFKLFTDYASSTFAIDARKRYRVLRGDNL